MSVPFVALAAPAPPSVARPRSASRPSRRVASCAAFTLVELLIVVVILAILAAIVLPTIGDSTKQTTQTAFISDLRNFGDAAILYIAKTGEYLEDSGSGDYPSGWDDYVRPEDWTNGTPVGGVWDMELDSFGVKQALGVHFNGVTPKDDAYMLEIDTAFDNGDLNSGAFRKIAADRFYYIIEA